MGAEPASSATEPMVVLRALTDDDAPRVLRLLEEQDLHWWGQVETDREELDQHLGLIRRAAGSLAAGGRIAEAEGEAVGFAGAIGHGRSTYAIAAERRSVASALFEWLFDSGVTEIEVPSVDPDVRAVVEQRSLVYDASSFELEQPTPLGALPAPLTPEGVEIVPWEERHAPGAHDAIYSVWGDVAAHAMRGYEEWRELVVDYDSFDPRINLIARRGDDVVGAAMCRYFPGPFGWVSQLAVRRGEQGRGLGRSLLVTALQRLADGDGVTGVGLSVEGVNRAALGLYQSVGLGITREWQRYLDPRAASQGER